MESNPVLKISKPSEPVGRVRYLDDDERTRLLAQCRVSRCQILYTVVVLALSTGARKGELLGLRWGDVDLKRGVFTFRKTKNGSDRIIPVTGHALDQLREYAKVRRIDSPFVFPNPPGNKPACIETAWLGAVDRAGLSDFRFHDLRHSAASYLAVNGASLLDIAHVLGHKSLSMTQKYAHLSESHTRGVVERMNRAVFGE